MMKKSDLLKIIVDFFNIEIHLLRIWEWGRWSYTLTCMIKKRTTWYKKKIIQIRNNQFLILRISTFSSRHRSISYRKILSPLWQRRDPCMKQKHFSSNERRDKFISSSKQKTDLASVRRKRIRKYMLVRNHKGKNKIKMKWGISHVKLCKNSDHKITQVNGKPCVESTNVSYSAKDAR